MREPRIRWALSNDPHTDMLLRYDVARREAGIKIGKEGRAKMYKLVMTGGHAANHRYVLDEYRDRAEAEVEMHRRRRNAEADECRPMPMYEVEREGEGERDDA